MKQNELEERLIGFAVEIIKIATDLKRSKAGFTMESQVVRSSTSPALNYAEARAAESSRDFIHKLQIVLKELRETMVALKIIDRAHLYSGSNVIPKVMKENDELISIFVKTILKAKQNYRRNGGRCQM